MRRLLTLQLHIYDMPREHVFLLGQEVWRLSELLAASGGELDAFVDSAVVDLLTRAFEGLGYIVDVVRRDGEQPALLARRLRPSRRPR